MTENDQLLIKTKSVKYPIIYMAIYLAIQMFFLYNVILFGYFNLHQSNEWGSYIFAIIWGMGNILPIIIVKLSDKWGYKESLIVGSILQILGFYLMSLGSINTFLVGASLFGSSMAFTVSQNYVVLSNTMKPEYKGRFNIFLVSYAVMNAAAFAVGIASGFADEIGYANVFRIGCICSIFILAYVIIFYHRAEGMEGSQAHVMASRPSKDKVNGFIKLLIVGIVVTVGLYFLCLVAPIANTLINVLVLLTILFILFLCFKYKGAARKKTIVFLFLLIITAVFWTGYNMYTGSAFTSILDSATALHGVAIQWALSMDPLVIIVFGIILSIVFMRMEKKGVHLNALMRIIFGLGLLTLGMFILYIGFHIDNFGLINVIWVMLSIGICGFGEIFIGPVGQAVAGQCAPEGLEGVFIASTFIIIGGTGATAAWLTTWMLNAPHTILAQTHHMSHVIGIFTLIALAATIIIIILYKPLTKAADFGKFKSLH